MLEIEKKILKVSFFLMALGTIIFFSLWTINYSLVWGWVIGCSSVITNFLVLILLTKKAFKGLGKKKIIWIFLLRFVSTSILHIVVFLLIIFINKRSSNLSFWGTSFQGINSPINIITYFCGISIIGVSIFLINLFQTKKSKGKSNGKNSK